MTKQHIVFLTGAGISVESGLSTFRGKDGLWTNEEWAYLASTDALYNDTQRCLDFYNFRRKQLADVEPNDAHRMIAELEKEHEVTVITQNVDNLLRTLITSMNVPVLPKSFICMVNSARSVRWITVQRA